MHTEWSRTSCRKHGDGCLTSKDEGTKMHGVYNMPPIYHSPTFADHHLCPGDSQIVLLTWLKRLLPSLSDLQGTESEANMSFPTDITLFPRVSLPHTHTHISCNTKGDYYSTAKTCVSEMLMFLVYENLVSQNKPMHLLHKAPRNWAAPRFYYLSDVKSSCELMPKQFAKVS